VSQDGNERRKYMRAVFAIQSGVEVTVALPGQASRRFVSPLLNLSAGGAAFFLPQPEVRPLQVGEQVRLERINGPEGLQISDEIIAEVKGVYTYPSFVNSIYGCEFIKIRLSTRAEIDTFVASFVAG